MRSRWWRTKRRAQRGRSYRDVDRSNAACEIGSDISGRAVALAITLAAPMSAAPGACWTLLLSHTRRPQDITSARMPDVSSSAEIGG
jgi:hypothetical protein